MTIYPLVGIGLPIVGPPTGPAAIREPAPAAGRLGFHSVSLSERIPPGDDSWRNDFGLPPHTAKLDVPAPSETLG